MIYTLLKERGEWKLVRSGLTNPSFVTNVSDDKSELVSTARKYLDEEARENDGMAVLLVKKANGEIQSVESRGRSRTKLKIEERSGSVCRYDLRLRIASPTSGTRILTVTVGSYVTKYSAREAAGYIGGQI